MKQIENTPEFREYIKTVKSLNLVLRFLAIDDSGATVHLVYQDENGVDLFSSKLIRLGPDDTLKLNVPLEPKIIITEN